ncbi:MAG: hypothetical protein EOR07_30270 [Mesorhizobium sp.]|nr:MAG: hypothetical protein EOR07_30270 [Mesorhizobium sp.]
MTPRGSQPISADRIARREINLFVDHSQIVQLEAHRSGIWGPRAPGGGGRMLGEGAERPRTAITPGLRCPSSPCRALLPV